MNRHRVLNQLIFALVTLFFFTGCSGELLDDLTDKMVEMWMGDPPEEELILEADSSVVQGDLPDSVQTIESDSSLASDGILDEETPTPSAEEDESLTSTKPSSPADSIPTEARVGSSSTPILDDPIKDSLDEELRAGAVEREPGEEPSEDPISSDSDEEEERNEDIVESIDRVDSHKTRINYNKKRLRNPFDFDPNNIIEPPPPPPPDVPPLPPIKLEGVSLDGIMWSAASNRRQALITGEDGKGYFITIGDKVKGVTVEDIQPDRIIFVQRGIGSQVQRAELKLKKDKK
ncbi:MAG: hypothetical protein B6244_02540 [Candidatus Cloacimonetes bacterium 4572_55]|nr:MAG: hypothetical protein B6244_02540 [Candidatus Cloacimonetes bacterium 4572_55]